MKEKNNLWITCAVMLMSVVGCLGGGYFVFVSAGLAIILLIVLLMDVCKSKQYILALDMNMLSLSVVTGMYLCVSLWAIDSGMAMMGFVKFLPVLLWEKCPRLAFCATLLSAWNLLPIYPLDGGRALRLLLRRNCKWAEWLLLLPAAFLLGLLLHRLGLPFWWASLAIPEKLLANFRENGYNRGNTEMR